MEGCKCAWTPVQYAEEDDPGCDMCGVNDAQYISSSGDHRCQECLLEKKEMK